MLIFPLWASSPDFALNPRSNISSRFLDICTGCSHRHLILNVSSIHPPPISSTLKILFLPSFPISSKATTIHPSIPLLNPRTSYDSSHASPFHIHSTQILVQLPPKILLRFICSPVLPLLQCRPPCLIWRTPQPCNWFPKLHVQSPLSMTTEVI